jgi:hypothetical protein
MEATTKKQKITKQKKKAMENKQEEKRNVKQAQEKKSKAKHNGAKLLDASITKISGMPLAIYHLGLALYFDNVLILRLYPRHKTKL